MAVAVALTPSLPTAATEVDPHDGVCQFDPAHLPHTPDAIEGWYAQCRNRERRSNRRRPTSPDAIDARVRRARG